MAKKRKIFKRIARCEYWSKCKVLYINLFVLTSSTKKWRAFFPNFIFVFELNWLKTGKYSNKWRGVDIDQSAMCYIWMDSSQQALQTNGRLFFKLCLPPTVTGEVYCFARRQLIFSFDRLSYIIRNVFESMYLATFQNRFRLSVPRSSHE